MGLVILINLCIAVVVSNFRTPISLQLQSKIQLQKYKNTLHYLSFIRCCYLHIFHHKFHWVFTKNTCNCKLYKRLRIKELRILIHLMEFLEFKTTFRIHFTIWYKSDSSFFFYKCWYFNNYPYWECMTPYNSIEPRPLPKSTHTVVFLVLPSGKENPWLHFNSSTVLQGHLPVTLVSLVAAIFTFSIINFTGFLQKTPSVNYIKDWKLRS